MSDHKPEIVQMLEANIAYAKRLINVTVSGIHFPHGNICIDMSGTNSQRLEKFFFHGFLILMGRKDSQIVSNYLMDQKNQNGHT